MKSKRGRLQLTKSSSPTKQRRLLSSFPAWVHPVAMNLQRTKPEQRNRRKPQIDDKREMTPSSPFCDQGYPHAMEDMGYFYQHGHGAMPSAERQFVSRNLDNHRHHFVPQAQQQISQVEARVDGNGMPTERETMWRTTYYGHGYPHATAVSPSYYPGHISSLQSSFVGDNLDRRSDLFVPKTPSPRSWNLTSPPKPRRTASTSLPFPYPIQTRYTSPRVPRNIKMPPSMAFLYETIGDPSVKIFQVKLPPHLLHLLDGIVLGCEAHAATLPNGWLTELYSLTKQDIALRCIPYLYEAAKPITLYLKKSIMALYGVKKIEMDRNQPHVLKYDSGHTGVELHHDKCDVTANLCLSRSSSYVGGGIWFPAAKKTVRLEYGEFVIHPGSLVHGGVSIERGTRHMMILFADVK